MMPQHFSEMVTSLVSPHGAPRAAVAYGRAEAVELWRFVWVARYIQPLKALDQHEQQQKYWHACRLARKAGNRARESLWHTAQDEFFCALSPAALLQIQTDAYNMQFHPEIEVDGLARGAIAQYILGIVLEESEYV